MGREITEQRKCRRCKGTGQHSNYGGDTRCFDCKGTGAVAVVVGYRAPTDEETAYAMEFAAGVAAREARTAARRSGATPDETRVAGRTAYARAVR